MTTTDTSNYQNSPVIYNSRSMDAFHTIDSALCKLALASIVLRYYPCTVLTYLFREYLSISLMWDFVALQDSDLHSLTHLLI